MPASKPSTIAAWATSATGLARTTTPPTLKQDDGWAPGEKPRASYWNWLRNLDGKWQAYLNDFEAIAHTWSALQTFSAGLSIPGGGIAVPSIVSNPSLNASWSYGTNQYFRYWLDPIGDVNLEVNIRATGSINGTGLIFTLPAGFRPGANDFVTLPGVYNTGGAALGAAGAVVTHLLVDGSGNLTAPLMSSLSGSATYTLGAYGKFRKQA